MKKLIDLEIYKMSEELSDLIWNLYDNWDFKAKQTIGIQIIRSADSISANIAEGYGRFNYLDRKKFYLYARGSFEETKTWLRKALRRNLVNSTDREKIVNLVNNLGPMLNSFIAKTKPQKD